MATISSIAKSLKAKDRTEGTLIGFLNKSIQETFHFYSPKVLIRDANSFIEAVKKGDRTQIIASQTSLISSLFANNTREIGYHASAVLDACPRRMYYEMFSDIPCKPPPKIEPELQRIFDFGTLIHAYIQFHLFKSGVLVAAEVPISLPCGIIGHTDGVIHLPSWANGEEDILEVKSINSRGYQRLLAPYDKHIAQASVYAEGLNKNKITFIYFNKDTSEVKEFRVRKDEKVVGKIIKKCESVNEAIEKKIPPDRVCVTIVSDLAIKCPYVNHCFKK